MGHYPDQGAHRGIYPDMDDVRSDLPPRIGVFRICLRKKSYPDPNFGKGQKQQQIEAISSVVYISFGVVG
jgi:hypothetical protein